MTEIVIAESLGDAVRKLSGLSRNGKVVCVCDMRFKEMLASFIPATDIYAVKGGEACKNISNIIDLWQWLQQAGATRSTLMLSIGGGSITDMSGYAASCFKRGMDTAYIPTTLLGAVDAAIGGKTAINFGGLKNEIGSFHEPRAVCLLPELWQTLPYEELASGYGEILKTALLHSEEFTRKVFSLADSLAETTKVNTGIVMQCADFKRQIVAQDMLETGTRKQLNLGHTFAHAFESLARERGDRLTHGHAVAIGLVPMSVLSHSIFGMDANLINAVADIVRRIYPPFLWHCKDFERLYGYMKHDKKNTVSNAISFTLLKAPGAPVVDVAIAASEVRNAIDIAADYLSL